MCDLAHDRDVSFRENVSRYRRAAGLSFNRLGKRSGLSASQVREIELGLNANPSLETIVKLARGLEKEERDLFGEAQERALVPNPPDRQGPHPAAPFAVRLAEALPALADDARQLQALIAGPAAPPEPTVEPSAGKLLLFRSPTEEPRFSDLRAVEDADRSRPDEVVAIPRVAIGVAAGFGSFPDPEEDPPTYTFRIGFMRHIGWNPVKPNWGRFGCVLMHGLDNVAGSMIPTIYPGSLVLFRRDPISRPVEIKRRGIYLVSPSGRKEDLAIKRVSVERVDDERGRLLLESDAPGFPEIDVRLDEETTIERVIHGKVVWWSVSAEDAER